MKRLLMAGVVLAMTTGVALAQELNLSGFPHGTWHLVEHDIVLCQNACSEYPKGSMLYILDARSGGNVQAFLFFGDGNGNIFPTHFIVGAHDGDIGKREYTCHLRKVLLHAELTCDPPSND